MRHIATYIAGVIAALVLATGAAAHKAATKFLPPHSRLWACIHRVEGPWHDRSGPYYGGLQMHWNWGYGIRGNAGNYSKRAQEWAAERGYRHGGIPFLYQQWFKWDGATYCLRYA